MKKIFSKSIISLLIILAIVISFSIVPVSATTSSSDPTTPTVEKTINGLTYRKYNYTDGGSQTLFYGEYKPSTTSEYEFVIHNVRDDSGSVTRTTVSDIAKDYEETTGQKVVMATNGDYFDLTSGQNYESLVINGVVYTIGAFTTKHCMGFNNNGTAVVGRMTQVQKYVEITVDNTTHYFSIDKVNSVPNDGELALYTVASSVTLNGCCKYKFKSTNDNILQLPNTGTSTRMVDGSVIDDKPLTLATGQFAIVVKGNNTLSQFLYKNIKYNKTIRLVNKPAGSFEGMPWVIGGYDILVNNGVVNTNCHTDNSGNVAAPRTFIGMKADGTMFLSVLDGRQIGYSVGCTVNREAELAKLFGAQYALELDGGGSSTFMIDLNDGKGLTVVNKPSDGSERQVSNAILLVKKSTTPEPEPEPTPSPTTSGCSCGSQVEITSSIVSAFVLISLSAIVFVIKKKKEK